MGEKRASTAVVGLIALLLGIVSLAWPVESVGAATNGAPTSSTKPVDLTSSTEPVETVAATVPVVSTTESVAKVWTETMTSGGLINGTRYYFRVNAVGKGASSDVVSTVPVAPAGCTRPAGTPGGPDPWGGCWPGPNNTGVPPGTSLSMYTGPCTISTADTVIDSKIVNCSLTITAQNVTIRNSRVNGTIYGDGGASFSLVDSEVVITSYGEAGATLVWEANFAVIRSDISGGNRGILCGAPPGATGCTVRDSWVHGQFTVGGFHLSGIRQTQNGVFVHNSIACDALLNSQDGGCSAPLTGYSDAEPVANNLIERNLFVAGNTAASQSGYCAYGGSASEGGRFGSQPSHVRFVDNVFQRGLSGICGVWGPITDFDPDRPGNVWTGNRYTDGVSIPAPD